MDFVFRTASIAVGAVALRFTCLKVDNSDALDAGYATVRAHRCVGAGKPRPAACPACGRRLGAAMIRIAGASHRRQRQYDRRFRSRRRCADSSPARRARLHAVPPSADILRPGRGAHYPRSNRNRH
jgi:hypothetical protein